MLALFAIFLMVQSGKLTIYQGNQMGVPKSKITRSKRGLRRAHDGIISRQYGECSNCGELKLSHHVCSACGYYGSGNKQRRVINKIESEVGDDED